MEQIRQGDIPGVQLKRRVEIAGSGPAEVWPFLVESGELTRWLCHRVRIEEGPPTVFWLESDDQHGEARREYAEVVERAEPRRLVLAFRQLDAGWDAATIVTFEISGTRSGCQVTVFQEGFHRLPLSVGLTVWESARARWTRSLERLTVIAGREGPI